MSFRRRVAPLLVLATLVLGTAVASHAGPCEVVPHTLSDVRNAVRAGARLRDALDRSGARMAIVARIGTDQSERGIRYTHAGMSWREHPQGRWHIVQLLNHCGRSTSELFDDGPVDFFLEHPFRYDAWVMVPEPRLQDGLVELFHRQVDAAIHTPSYSAIAHPFRTRYQNSNQWVLELIALALDDSAGATRESAQQVLRLRGFVPERVRLGFFERVGARRMENVSLGDHRRSELRDGGYEYVSVRSIARFLAQNGVLSASFEIPAAPNTSGARARRLGGPR